MRFFLLSLLFLTLARDVSNFKEEKPVIFIIGDSTVKNGRGNGADGLWGWGNFLYEHFDTTKIKIENHAIGGRSSRTFITEGRWDNVLERMKPGDFLLLQFGHNDAGRINDSTRARGTIRGTGNETEEIDNMLTGKREIVYTYGWYLKKYIADARSKGVTPIVCSLVARNRWKDGKVMRAANDYAKWAAESAATENACFINLNDLVADYYDGLGQAEVTKRFFPKDHTHTNEAGARLNASLVAAALVEMEQCDLKQYLRK